MSAVLPSGAMVSSTIPVERLHVVDAGVSVDATHDRARLTGWVEHRTRSSHVLIRQPLGSAFDGGIRSPLQQVSLPDDAESVVPLSSYGGYRWVFPAVAYVRGTALVLQSGGRLASAEIGATQAHIVGAAGWGTPELQDLVLAISADNPAALRLHTCRFASEGSGPEAHHAFVTRVEPLPESLVRVRAAASQLSENGLVVTIAAESRAGVTVATTLFTPSGDHPPWRLRTFPLKTVGGRGAVVVSEDGRHIGVALDEGPHRLGALWSTEDDHVATTHTWQAEGQPHIALQGEAPHLLVVEEHIDGTVSQRLPGSATGRTSITVPLRLTSQRGRVKAVGLDRTEGVLSLVSIGPPSWK